MQPKYPKHFGYPFRRNRSDEETGSGEVLVTLKLAALSETRPRRTPDRVGVWKLDHEHRESFNRLRIRSALTEQRLTAALLSYRSPKERLLRRLCACTASLIVQPTLSPLLQWRTVVKYARSSALRDSCRGICVCVTRLRNRYHR